jgi:hypothetical protein
MAAEAMPAKMAAVSCHSTVLVALTAGLRVPLQRHQLVTELREQLMAGGKAR